MRCSIEESPYLQATLVNPNDLSRHIYSNTTIDMNSIMLGDVYIHSGAELTINAEVEMGHGTRILVERNARLKVLGNGKLTKRCDAPDWAGIQVLGNNQMVQPAFDAPLNNINQAGIVCILGGTIEYARCGVTTGGGYDAEYWGAPVLADHATFQFNRKDAEFMSYKFATNTSKFKDTKLWIGLPGTSTEGVTIWETDGIEFSNCDITGKAQEGIRTYDAAINMHNDCDLESNKVGISSYASYPMDNTTLIGDLGPENSFYGNEYDIFASLNNGWFGTYSNGKFSLNVTNNNFEGSKYGVVVDGSSNYRIGGNKFTDVGYSVFVMNTGVNNLKNHNLVGCNLFESRYEIAVAAIGDNKEMQFLGNDFNTVNTTSRDFFLSSVPFIGGNGAIRQTQGNADAPAYNCFTAPGTIVDIQTSGSTDPFMYYYQTGNTPVTCDANPLTPGNYSKQSVQNPFYSLDCDQFGGLPTGFEHPTPNDLNTKRQLLQQLAPYVNTDASARNRYYQTMQDKEAILKYLLDQALSNHDQTLAESLLTGEQSKAADWAIFGLRMQRGDFVGAGAWLQQLPVQSDLDASFREIQTINIQRLQHPGSFQLTDAQENYLSEVAESQSPIRGYARAILGILNDRHFYPDPIQLEEDRQQTSAPLITTNQGVRLSPVPATDRVLVSWAPLEKNSEPNLQVFDVYGKSYLRIDLNAGETQTSFGLENWPAGLYFIRICNKEKLVYQSKLVVHH